MVYVCKTWQSSEPKACKTTRLISTVSAQWCAGGRASCRSFYCVFLSLHLWQVRWTSEARASATTHFSYWCQLLLSLSPQRMSGKMFFFLWFPAWQKNYTMHKKKEKRLNKSKSKKNLSKMERIQEHSNKQADAIVYFLPLVLICMAQGLCPAFMSVSTEP